MWPIASPEDSTTLRGRWTLPAVFAFLRVLGALTTQEQPTLPMHFKKLALTTDQEENVLKVRGEYDAKFAALRKHLQELEVQEKAAVEKTADRPAEGQAEGTARTAQGRQQGEGQEVDGQVTAFGGGRGRWECRAGSA